MNRAGLSTLSTFWQSPNFPVWLTIVAAALFAVVLLITLLRAEKSVANGALTVITLLAVGIAVASMMRVSSVRQSERSAGWPTSAAPSLACLDEMAGDSVGAACEKAVFASAESTAAAVSYTAAQITKLGSFGNVAAADAVMTPELRALRRAVERDRFGLVAYVLTVRDGCSLSECRFFQSLTNTAQISNNMNEQVYEGLVRRYAQVWNAPASALPPVVATAPALVAPIGSAPSGKPVSGDFPASSTSIPPISIMSPEPATSSVAAPAKGGESKGEPKAAPAKKPAKPKSLAPTPAGPEAAPAAEDNQ
jgi:hypothetical protein